MILNNYKDILVDQNISLMEAVKKMNKTSKQILLVLDSNNRLSGIITDGDIRRALINKLSFNESVKRIMNTNPITLKKIPSKAEALTLMKKYDVRHFPIIDDQNRLKSLVLWKDFIESGDISLNRKKNKVVIMAGGKGTRLDPFTKILPKPLIPIGENPIIEHIMKNFSKYGFNDFVISLNYKADMIKLYFSENYNNFKIDYTIEKKILGTAGSLSLCKDILKDTFIVSNCDVLINANFNNLFDFHIDNSNHATILGTFQIVKIPYGILKTNNEILEDIIEKPEFNYLINSGIYVLDPVLIKLIPDNKEFSMPDLLIKAKKNGYKVKVFPMLCSWFDIGQWEEYRKAIDYLNTVKSI